jgi:chromosome segregation ATPase
MPVEYPMAILKRSLGFGGLLLAVLGLLVCVGGIIGVHVAKTRVDAVGAAVFETADDALAFVDTKLDRVKQVVETSRKRVSGVSRIAERLRKAEADARKECEPALQTLDEVYQELKSAESWLDSSHAVASGISRVSEAVAQSEFAASRQDSKGVAVALEIQQFAEAVADALAKLQAMRSELTELRDTGKLARDIAVGILARVAALDRKLADLAARIEKLDARVTRTKESCNDLDQKFGWWTALAAVMATAILAWFGISQIVMMAYGWRLVRAVERRPGSSGAAT